MSSSLFGNLSPHLLQLAWLSFGLLLGCTQLAACVLLLRERHPGPWLMLAGAVVSTLCGATSHALIIHASLRGSFNATSILPKLLAAVSVFSSLGTLAFAIGLLLYACHRRSLATLHHPTPSH